MLLLMFLNFIFGLSVDLFYVIWMKAVNKDNAVAAVLASMLMALCSIFGFVSIVGHWYYSIPYLVGLGTGTYVGMRFQELKAFTKMFEWLKYILRRQ